VSVLVQDVSRAHAAQRGSARRLNVLFVTDHLGYVNGVIHGASRYYLQVLPRFDRQRFNVQLCILRGWHPFAEELEQVGVRPIFLDCGKWDPRALWDLDVLVKRERVDVLHCLAMKGCLFGRLVGRARGIPALIHLHDTQDPGAVLGFLQRQVAPWTARAVAVSELVRQFAIEKLGVRPERTEVLHNGSDVEWFANPAVRARELVRRELGIALDAPVVLAAGRVVQGKGQRELVQRWPRVLEWCAEAVLLVAGDGTDLQACKEAATAAGVEQAVRFTGQRKDMPELLAACDVATMPSLMEEGFGYTALEAAAAGRPVVAFDTGALREIVESGVTGEVVPRGDMEALLVAICAILGDEGKRQEMGARAAVHAQRFGIEAHVARLEALYEELSAACQIGRGSR